MKRKVVFLIIILIIFIMALLIYIRLSNTPDEKKLLKVSAETPEAAALVISNEIFKNNKFDDIIITDTKLIDCKQLNEYKDLTEKGKVYSYELIYYLKTDDERALINNKIDTGLIVPGEWIEEAPAHRCIVFFENEGVYYNLFSWDNVVLGKEYGKEFYYTKDEYGTSNGCMKDWLECNIVKSVFENEYNISDMKASSDMTSESVCRKLIQDIYMWVKPEYKIDESKSRVYDFSFDKELQCIYFKADVFDSEGNAVFTNKVFSLFLNGGFSIYEIGPDSDYVPKSLN